MNSSLVKGLQSNSSARLGSGSDPSGRHQTDPMLEFGDNVAA